MGEGGLHRNRDGVERDTVRGDIGRQAKKSQRRQEADDRMRHATTDGGEGVVFREAVSTGGIEPAGELPSLSVSESL